LLRALPLLEGQVDWQQEVKRRGELARGSLLALARRRLALVRRWLVLVPALQPVLALALALFLVLALVLQLV